MKRILPIIGLYLGIAMNVACQNAADTITKETVVQSPEKITEFYSWANGDTTSHVAIDITPENIETGQKTKISSVHYLQRMPLPVKSEYDSPVRILYDIADISTPFGQIDGNDRFQMWEKTSSRRDTTYYNWNGNPAERQERMERLTRVLQDALQKVYAAKDPLIGKILLKQ
jgi:hypothetical protein